MKKEVAAALMGAMMVCGNAFAMQFGQPEKLGSASATDAYFKTYKIKGAVYNRDGIAKFGNDENAIFFYQHPAVNKFCYGSADVNNTFPFLSAYGCEFTKIETDTAITFFMVHEWEFASAGEKYILLGRKPSGEFIKYFHTNEVRERYSPSAYFMAPTYDGDTIVIEYKTKRYLGAVGAFRFKWDDAAQWFGVEQVVY